MLHLINAANRHQPELDHLLEQSYRVRYDLYVKGRGWRALDRPDGREVDQFDNEHATYLIWADDEEVVGGARFVPTDRPHLMSEVFPHTATFAPIPRNPKIWEITRLFTSRGGRSTANRRNVTSEVFCGMFELALNYELEAITVVCDTFFLPRLLDAQIDLTPLGLPTPYDEGTCIACYIPVTPRQLGAARNGRRECVLFPVNAPVVHRAPVTHRTPVYASH